MIINFLTIIISSIFEMYISHTFFFKFGKIRFKSNIYFLFFSLISILSILFSSLFIGNSIIFFSYYILLFLHSLLFFLERLKRFLLCLLLLIIASLSETLSTMLITIVMDIDIKTLQSTFSASFICVIISKLLTFSIIKPIKNRTIVSDEKKPMWFNVSSSILPLTSIFIIIVLYKYSYLINKDSYQLITMITSILLIVSNFSILFIHDKQEEYYNTKRQLSFAEILIKNQIAHYKDLYAQQEMIKKFQHDSKNFYISLISTLEQKTTSEAVEYIKNKLSIVANDYDTVNSGNPVIDSVIWSKKLVCQENKISLIYTIHLETDICIDQIELGVLIGNALDNAIEATKQIHNVKNRKIYIQIISAGDMISIEIKNNTKTNINTYNLETTKTNKQYHGYGLKSIRTLVEKYNGNLSISCADNIFILSAVIVNA